MCEGRELGLVLVLNKRIFEVKNAFAVFCMKFNSKLNVGVLDQHFLP